MIKIYGRNTAAGIGEFLGHLLHYYIICYTTVLWSKNMSFQLSAFWRGAFFRHNFPRGVGAIFPLGFFWGTFFLFFFSDGIFPGTVIFNLGNIQVIGNINGRIDKCWNSILKFADKIFLSSTNLIEFLFEDLSLKKRSKIFQNILFSVIEIVLSF